MKKIQKIQIPGAVLVLALALALFPMEALGQSPAEELPSSTAYDEDEEEGPGLYDPKLEEEEPEAVVAEPEPEPEPEVEVVTRPEARKPVKVPKAGPKPFSVTGSNPLALEDTAIRLDLGYPELGVGYHIPIDRRLEVVPVIGMFYQTAAADTGLFARCEIKWAFFQDKEHGLALIADPGVMIPIEPDPAFAVIAGGPGVLYDYTVAAKHHLTAALQVPWGLFFGDDFAARIPVILKMGAEFSVADDLNFFFIMSGGGDIWSDDYGTDEARGMDVGPYLKMTLGVAIRM